MSGASYSPSLYTTVYPITTWWHIECVAGTTPSLAHMHQYLPNYHVMAHRMSVADTTPSLAHAPISTQLPRAGTQNVWRIPPRPWPMHQYLLNNRVLAHIMCGRYHPILGPHAPMGTQLQYEDRRTMSTQWLYEDTHNVYPVTVWRHTQCLPSDCMKTHTMSTQWLYEDTHSVCPVTVWRHTQCLPSDCTKTHTVSAQWLYEDTHNVYPVTVWRHTQCLPSVCMKTHTMSTQWLYEDTRTMCRSVAAGNVAQLPLGFQPQNHLLPVHSINWYAVRVQSGVGLMERLDECSL